MRIISVLFMTMTAIIFTAPIMAQNPYTAVNNTWLTLNGTVTSAGPSGFELNYGKGSVRVEMDGWQWYHADYPIIDGSRVRVHGKIDDDRWEITSIEADSVYVKDLNTYFYANEMDEEDIDVQAEDSDKVFILRGTIKQIKGREFLLNTGAKEVKVDTLELSYNPLDNEGYQKLKPGDYVQVSGEIDADFFEKAEIMADSVTTLVKDPLKKVDR